MRLFARLLLIAFAGLLARPLAAADLGDELDDQGAFWAADVDAFMAKHRTVLYWTTGDHASATHYANRLPEPLLFAGLPAAEATVRFADGKPAKVELVLFNRADAGEQFGRKQFEAKVAEVRGRISAWAGSPGRAGGTQRVTDKMRIEQHFWRKGPHRLELAWNASGGADRKFRAEFIQLTVAPAAVADANAGTAARPAATALQVRGDARKADLKANVKTEEDGSVYIAGVPMVDQGPRGYCAVAVSERVLRYYGSEVNQHVLAQLAGSDAGMGTKVENLFLGLKKAGARLGITVREVIPLNGSEVVSRFKGYNSFAKRAKVEMVAIPRNGGTIDQLYEQVDPERFLAFMKEKEKGDFRKFQDAITRTVPTGVPLVWTVIVGLYPETPALPQARGGHARLIIGYNLKTQEVLYTDSWGAGHELKRLPFDQAFAMTTGLATFVPRGR
ncbi:MAG: hypothetical protein WC789_02905 [Lentisphaeria bacterium]|jgi:hypothetical protein